uniref:non-specific serine/threonine protein kinase n=1 Tax=Populus trichocarpa TaxID=3694 RepID=A0A2K1YET0_POPTR|eukprot:XP_006373142.2 cysteine-rich receptor-like protein kinase 10 [Populus trichocarpa]
MGHNFLSDANTIQLLLLLYFSIATLSQHSSNFLTHPPYKFCSNTSLYEANSPFQNNLQTLMSYLASNASVSNQYHAYAGNDPDIVYAQYMCYNYIENCSACIYAASQDIMQLCPNNRNATVWEELCQLRFSNKNFIGQLDISGNILLANKETIENSGQYISVVNEKFSNLTKKAAFDPTQNMYATGKLALSDIDTLYTLGQCTTDLSSHDCNTCLQVAIQNISSCCYIGRGQRLLSQSCYFRFELYPFYEGTADSGETLTILKIVLGTCIPTVVLAFLTASCIIYFRRIRRKETDEEKSHLAFLQELRKSSGSTFAEGNKVSSEELPWMMDLSVIRAATDNFSVSNKLGQGGFGSVYKGILSDGSEVAVKRLSRSSEQGVKEFKTEVLLIMKLQHKNLVRLLGFCVEGEEKLLVYEFMPNSSLDVFLFDPTKRAELDWSSRIDIINGIAKGMLYLHEDSRLRIIHRDLKASNVLLDNEMNPKISDFGMARIFSSNEDEANTARIVGTYGYMAPEYAMEGLYSTKSDVFSFGVLLLEIISGRKKAGYHQSKCAPSLLAYAWQLWNEGNKTELIDPMLSDSCNADEFSRYMHIGLLCVQEDASDRPTMSSVVLMLQSQNSFLPQPERPAFVGRFMDNLEAAASNFSVNEMTLSDVGPR